MTLEIFQQMIADGLPLEGEEIIEFMRNQSDESLKIQFELNSKYHTPEEIRQLFSKITGCYIEDTFKMFPSFYSDFGRNILLARMYSSTPVASFKIKAASTSAMIA